MGVARLGREGFTLIELMVVVAIISVLSSVALTGTQVAVRKAKIVAAKSNLDSMVKAAHMYASDRGDYPSGPVIHCHDPYNDWDGPPNSGTCNCFQTMFVDLMKPYGKFNVKDPWGTCYIYHYHSGTNEGNFILSLGPNKTGDWGEAHGWDGNLVPGDDNLAVWFGRGEQRW